MNLKILQIWFDKIRPIGGKGRIHYVVEPLPDCEWETPFPDLPDQNRVTWSAIVVSKQGKSWGMAGQPYDVPESEHSFRTTFKLPVKGTLYVGKVFGTRQERVMKMRKGKLDEEWDHKEFSFGGT